MFIHTEDRRGPRGQEGRSHDSLLSFFRPGFMRKDVAGSPVRGADRRLNSLTLGKLASINSAKLSLSNGTLEERRAPVAHRCDTAHTCRVQLVNGQAGRPDPADIQRAHSSTNIQTKLDLSVRRCASLQRNGEVLAPPGHRVLLPDKPGYAALQRTRYSTTSLVPL